jgi:hypothetical protein
MIPLILLLALLASSHEITACAPQVTLQDGADLETVGQAIKDGTMPPVAVGIKCKLTRK